MALGAPDHARTNSPPSSSSRQRRLSSSRWRRRRPPQRGTKLHRPSSSPTRRAPRAERAVERGHGAGVALVVVVDEGAQRARQQERQPLRAQHAARAGGVDAGGGQHPLLRAHRQAVERERERRIARAPSAAASAPPPCGAPSFSMRRISTSNSRSRGGSSAMSLRRRRAPRGRSSLTCAAKIASFEPNSPRSRAERDAGARRRSRRRPICSNGFSASSAIKAATMRSRVAARAGGWAGRTRPMRRISRGRLCGPWRPPCGTELSTESSPQSRRFQGRRVCSGG